MIKILVNNLSKNQKIALIVFLQVVMIIIIAFFMNVGMQPKEHVEVNNKSSVNIPSDSWEGLKRELWYLIKDNAPNLSRTNIDDATIRDGTYEVSTRNDITTAKFLLDIDSIKQTYAVTVSWSDKVELYDTLSINCPSKDKMKYQDSVCYSANNNTYSLSLYLPHEIHSTEGGEEVLDAYINGNELDHVINVEYSGCNLEETEKKVKEFLASMPIDLDEYEIKYSINESDVNCDNSINIEGDDGSE